MCVATKILLDAAPYLFTRTTGGRRHDRRGGLSDTLLVVGDGDEEFQSCRVILASFSNSLSKIAVCRSSSEAHSEAPDSVQVGIKGEIHHPGA